FRVNASVRPTWYSVRDFLAAYDLEVPEIKAARAALVAGGVDLKRIPVRQILLDKDHRLKIDVAGSALSDLAPLHGLSIKELQIGSAKVIDLSPLRGMPLSILNIGGTMVHDLSPLRGLPLVSVNLTGSYARDVSPLADCKELEEVRLRKDYENVESL